VQAPMDILKTLTRILTDFSNKSEGEKALAFNKFVKVLTDFTSWSAAAKDLWSLSKSELTADKFGLTDDEFSDLKKKTDTAKDSNFALTLFQKSICKKLSLVLIEVEKDNVDRFEDAILPLLIMAADLPIKYLPENDPFGAIINYSAHDSFNKGKSFLYAPMSYKTPSLTPISSSSNAITRPFIIPILQFVINSDRYITSKRLKDVPFLVQCLRFAVHFEDPELDILRSSFWELAIKVIKAVDRMKTNESKAIFDQLNALTWYENGEQCTKAVLRSSGSSPLKSLVMPRDEVYAFIALLRGINRRVSVNSHIKSCFRDVIKSMMKSISYRKSSEDCMVLLKLLDSWIRKGKDGPLDVQLVRMVLRDVMEAYDSFLAKSPNETMGETTTFLLRLAQESLAILNNLKSVKSWLECLFDRVNSGISKSGKDGNAYISKYVSFLTVSLDGCKDSPIDTNDTPWNLLFRAVFLRCFVHKMKMEWVDKSERLVPLFKIMAGLLKIATEGLEKDNCCDYMNECIPTLTDVVYLIIKSPLENDKKWKCIVSLCNSEIPSNLIRSISYMKNQSAKAQCSLLICQMIEPLTGIIKSHPPKTTLSHFESFYTVSLTIDLPQEIRDSVCTLWKCWYGSRMDELSGASITEELMGRLKWFNLPIPSNTINEKLEVKREETGTSPKKSVSTPSTRKRGSLFSAPAAIKKPKNGNDALKMIDLMDEDSVQFFPVEDSPKKKQRMTEKQKEMMMEKKDRLPFIEDESATGTPKIPTDIFEMSVSCVEGSSKSSVGSRKGHMKTDFSDLTMEKKSDGDGVMKEANEKEMEKKTERGKLEIVQKKTNVDYNIEECSSSCESMNEENEGEEKKGGRRKAKTPMKHVMKTRELGSPSRKKLDSTMSVDSPKRKTAKMGKIEENEKKMEEEEGEENKKKKRDERESSVEVMEMVKKEDKSEMSSDTPKRSDKITLSPIKKEGNTIVKEGGGRNGGDEGVVTLGDTLNSSLPSSVTSSPIKSSDGNSDLPVPRTPANRGAFEPVGILSSSKKGKSEKKKGGVHFNISEEVKKIDEVNEEEEEEE
ncbi:hypothetical protein PENTCL1PPCAC_17811, partial [Pristionchus entomophagus]